MHKSLVYGGGHVKGKSYQGELGEGKALKKNGGGQRKM